MSMSPRGKPIIVRLINPNKPIVTVVAELKPAVKQFTHVPCTKEGALYKDDELMRATRQPVRLKKDFKRPADKVEK